MSYQNWVGFGKDKWLEVGSPAVYINHSCQPNAGIKGRVTVVALKNILKGEEIKLDYSITEEDLLWQLEYPCNCGTKDCRKIIRSIQGLPEKTFKKYLPFVPTYFRKVYEKRLK